MIYSSNSLRSTIAFILAGVTLSPYGTLHAEKIRTAIPQANLNYLSIFVADAKGFFRDE